MLLHAAVVLASCTAGLSTTHVMVYGMLSCTNNQISTTHIISIYHPQIDVAILKQTQHQTVAGWQVQ
jgi:hypothetical protein